MTERPVFGGSKIPIRVVHVVERDGRTVRALHVFCSRQRMSVDPLECAGCSCALAVSKRVVVCSLPAASRAPRRGQPLFLGPDALGLRTPIGVACTPRVIAFRVGAPSAELDAALSREPFVVVLDEDDRVREILSERFGAEVPVGVHGAGVETLGESDPLSDAIEWMVRRGRRVLPVGDARARFIGVVTDLDLLRWARGRTR